MSDIHKQEPPAGFKVVPLTDGELWSFLRTVAGDGAHIEAWHAKEGREHVSMRLDAQAARRADELRAMLAAAPEPTPPRVPQEQKP